MYYLSNNSFKLLVHKDTNKTCTVISLTSGKIYRCPASQIFNSKKGTLIKVTRRTSNQVTAEYSIYNLILEGKKKGLLGKGVSINTYNKMVDKIKQVNSYEK